MPEISLLALAICLLPTLGVMWLSQRWARSGGEVLYATARMLGQLLAVGFVLVWVFEAEHPGVGFAVIGVMVLASSWIAVRTVKKDQRRAFWWAALSLTVVGNLVLAFVLFAVLQLQDPWYQPRLMIPLAGMIFSNSMTAITLAAERLARESDGGMDFEAARSAAWSAALIPQINSLLAVGLVSLPGMMTGQILSGVDPLIAVLLQASGFAVALFLWLARPKP